MLLSLRDGVNKVETLARCYVMTVLQACWDWMSLMEGAGPGLIAVLVLELNYAGCTLLVVAHHVP